MAVPLLRPTIISVLSASLLLLNGCNDASSVSQADAAQAMKEATSAAFIANGDPEALAKVLRSLQSISGGTDTQMAARDRLVATIEYQLAVGDLAGLQALELANRRDLFRLRAMSDASLQLSTFASARESQRFQDVPPELAEDRDRYAALVEQSRAQADELGDSARNTMEDLRALDEKVLNLRRQAQGLRQSANMADLVERYPLINRAITLEMEADQIDAQMARRQLQLDLDVLPRQAALNRNRSEYSDQLTEIDAAHDSLATASRLAGESADQARQDLRRLDGEMTSLSKKVSQVLTGEVRDQFKGVNRRLDAALTSVRKAKRGTTGKLSREELQLLTNDIELARADAATVRVRSLDEWILVLTLLASNDDLGNRDAWKLEAEEARTQRDEAAKMGIDAIDSLLQSANPDLADARRDLEVAKAFLAQTDPPEAPSAATTSNRPTSGRSRGSAGGGGAVDPAAQVLIDGMKASMASGNPQQMVTFQDDNTYFSDPARAAEARASSAFTLTLLDIKSAVQSSFGGSLPGVLSLMTAGVDMMGMIGMAEWGNLETSGTRGSFVISMMGNEVPVPIIKIDGEWKLDGDDEGISSMSTIPDAAALNRQATDVLAKVRSGAISDQAALDRAMQGIVDSIMQMGMD